jgi:hypothetical protein
MSMTDAPAPTKQARQILDLAGFLFGCGGRI